MTSTKRLAALFAVTAVVAFTLTACGGGGSSTPPPPPPPPPPPATGTLTVSDCQIAQDAASCTTNIVWTTAHATAPGVFVGTSTTANWTTASGTQPTAIPYGPTVVTLKNGSTQLDQKTANASCVTGTTWNGNLCVAPVSWPPLSLTPVGIEVNGANQLHAGCTSAAMDCWKQALADGTVKVIQTGVVVSGRQIDFAYYISASGLWNELPIYDDDGSLFGPDIFGGGNPEIDHVEGKSNGLLYHDNSINSCFMLELNNNGNFSPVSATCTF